MTNRDDALGISIALNSFKPSKSLQGRFCKLYLVQFGDVMCH
ncbi:MAG: hypothetical protein ACTSUR_03535 [Candidatus Heimdallarchaeaceae archaeon]